MFSNVYQKGQTGVEVLLASGKNPGTNWEISTSGKHDIPQPL